MKSQIEFQTSVRNYNGSMKVEIFDGNRLVYSGASFSEGPGKIDFMIDWPSKVKILVSNKNPGDTLVDKHGQIIKDKSIEITGVSMNGFFLQIDLIDKIFDCRREGQTNVTHENYWGFNGIIELDLTHTSPMRYMLSLRNQFDVTRLQWEKYEK